MPPVRCGVNSVYVFGGAFKMSGMYAYMCVYTSLILISTHLVP